MTVEVTGISADIDFGAQGIAQIQQNVRFILTTVMGSVPLDRTFGIDPSLVDAPIPTAQSRLTAEIIRAVRAYEPRARVMQVKYGGDALDGQLIPTVVMEVET